MHPQRKFWNLNLISDYNKRPIIDLLEVDPDYRDRLEKS
jgi:hypothetical protein